MSFNGKKVHTVLKTITFLSLSFLVLSGLYEVVASVRPFWIDEWRIIYNIKFKSHEQLWGQLDFMQQFPRVYLNLIKSFCEPLHYSYFSLRFPSFVVALLAIGMCYRLMRQLFQKEDMTRYLFLSMILSAYTFTEYFVQVKQYTMDIFLSLVAISQLLTLQDVINNKEVKWWRYGLLCMGFAVVPFFSYTYPIVIAPVFIIMVLQTIALFKRDNTSAKTSVLIKTWLPLLICGAGIVVFYRIDVSQVMKDCGMKQYWGNIMMLDGFHPLLFFKNFFLLFAQVGSGLLFQIIIGVTGVAAFIWSITDVIKNKARAKSGIEIAVLYSLVLLLIVLLLFAAGKLPVAEARLNCFTVPAITILIIRFFNYLSTTAIKPKIYGGIAIVIFLGTSGHFFSSYKKAMNNAEHSKKLNIYRQTEDALRLAEDKNIPLVVTPQVAYPYDTVINFPCCNQRATVLCYPQPTKSANDFTTGINQPADWIVKTLPAYSSLHPVEVYAVDSLQNTDVMKKLPQNVTSVVAFDGSSFTIVVRKS